MSEGSRLSRWSQRKLAARHGGAIPEVVDLVGERDVRRDQTQSAPVVSPEALAEKPSSQPKTAKAGVSADPISSATESSAETMLTEADLPAIDGLTAQSDFTVFLKNNVPEGLRKAALRKLWVSDPVLANLDRLNDYDDDYTIVTAMTMDDTIYKVGRGLLDDVAKLELSPHAAPAETDESGSEAAGETAPTSEAAATQSLKADAEPAHNVTPDAAPPNGDGSPSGVDANDIAIEPRAPLQSRVKSSSGS